MKKINIIFLTFFVFSLAFGLKIENNKIVDNYGNSIKNKIYNRVIILDPSVVEIFYILNSQDKITAIANTQKSSIWPEEKTSLLKKVGTITKPSLEQVVINSPDLVILNPMVLNFGNTLKEKGINFIVNEGNNFNDILENLKIYGNITGKKEEAITLYNSYTNKLNKIKKDKERNNLNLKGVFIYSASPMMSFGDNSLPGEIFQTLGIKNIATNLPGARPIISQEYIITENPDLIVGAMSINNKNDILDSNPIVKNTTAGKNNNIFILDSQKILRPTPRIIDELGSLHEMLKNIKK